MEFDRRPEPETLTTITIKVAEEGLFQTKMEGNASPGSVLAALIDNYMKVSEVLIKAHKQICMEPHCHTELIHASIRSGIKNIFDKHHAEHGMGEHHDDN